MGRGGMLGEVRLVENKVEVHGGCWRGKGGRVMLRELAVMGDMILVREVVGVDKG